MALYNGGYPATYQNPYFVQQYAQPQQPQQNGGLIWIQGESAAKSYLVAPNTSVVLFDSESQTVYIKSADASGMPSMKILDYTIRDVQSKAQRNEPPHCINSQRTEGFLQESVLRIDSRGVKPRQKGRTT